ncbi:MAG: PHP domain-containing protein, partial [Lentisphaeria bacterium]
MPKTASFKIAELEEKLNHPESAQRLAALKDLTAMVRAGDLAAPSRAHNVNNHIHTTYSFSPYSPTKALWMAYNSGLATSGIMDHDSVSGAAEFTEAGRIIGMGTTVGAEIRVSAENTRLAGRRINNPDQETVIYMAIHGIPPTQLSKADDFLKPVREARNKRNVAMVEKINQVIRQPALELDFEEDVMPLSMCHEAGSITERHILFALARKLVATYGRGRKLLQAIEDELEMNVSSKVENFLLDADNPHYEYDLLGALKSDFVPQMYIAADAELVPVEEAVRFAADIGAVSAYAYLGDISQSVTGDKKAQKFEDDYLDLLFDELARIGFNAVTYMPSRNTMKQLLRVKEKCREHGLFQISGEDINSPRQSFICEALKNPEFNNLFDATYALIGHELEAGSDLQKALFSAATA